MKYATNSPAKADFSDMVSLRLHILLVSLFMAVLPVFSTDSEGEGLSNSFMLEIGSAHRSDTYLTPLRYNGWNTALSYEHIHPLRAKPFVWTLNVGLELDRTMNPVRNAVMYGAQFDARWSFQRSWMVAKEIELGVGPATSLRAGALYLSRNGNNPVAANASWTLDVAPFAVARFDVGKLPVVATYRAALPLVGAMFAPDYGQLYYEIYLGDRRNLVNTAYWGRYFRLDQQLTLDLKVGAKYLRVGYAFDFVNSKVKNIDSRRVNHNFIFGITI